LQDEATRRFGAFEDVIYKIAFSVDGRRIAIGLYDNAGLKVLDAASGAELLADRHYRDTIYGVAFSADGSLTVTSFDGYARLYSRDLHRTAKRAPPVADYPIGSR
jgi:WD40 repeat protein